MQNWSSIKFLWSCDTRAQDSFSLFKSTQCFQNMFFINSRIHLSPFWVFGKIFTAFTLQVYTHFFKNRLWSVKNFFQRKVGSYLYSKACWFFSQITYFLFPLFFLFSYYRLFISFFLFFSLKRSCRRGCTLPTHA